MVTFIAYPPCSTCKKAQRFLRDHGIEHTMRHIVETPPTAEEIKAWVNGFGVDPKKLFNTHGKRYRELDVKAMLPSMSHDDIVSLLSDDGMLVKRPVLVGEGFVLVGFKENEWREKLLA